MQKEPQVFILILRGIIQILQQIQQGSPGFQNHGHKILEQLKRVK